MKRTLSNLALIAAIAIPSLCLAQETEGRRLAQLAFGSMDGAERGFIDQGEFFASGSDVFFSMDSDRNSSLTLSEFLNWDYGMLLLAQDAGREDAYWTALRVVFAFWDRDGDGQISRTEHRQSLIVDFRRADTDHDAILTEDEFTSGFSIMVALRAAINPAPAE